MTAFRRLLSGFRFGMLLQFSIGPVCLYIFETGASGGFLTALPAVLAVALVDALYIFAAIAGISNVLRRKNVQPFFRVFGSVVLMLFGVSAVCGALDIQVLPSLHPTLASGRSAFLCALVLTASSPLTILFWAGVFSAKVAGERMPNAELSLFGSGAVLSTVAFLTCIALLGSLLSSFLPTIAIQLLNIAVGLALIVFGLVRLLKRESKA